MNCSENTRTATQRAKQNLWFRRMFSVALLIGVLIGFLFAKVPIWFSTPEPTTTAVLYGAYTGQAVKVQSDGTIVQAGDFTPLNVPMDESLQEYVYWMADAYQWLCLLGIPALIAGVFKYLHTLIKRNADDNKALKLGVQALLRSQMISDFNKYSEKGYAPIYARESFENCWKQYHSLGVNGVMDDLHKKFLELPTEAPDE